MLDLSGYNFDGFYVQATFNDVACTQVISVEGMALGVCYMDSCMPAKMVLHVKLSTIVLVL